MMGERTYEYIQFFYNNNTRQISEPNVASAKKIVNVSRSLECGEMVANEQTILEQQVHEASKNCMQARKTSDRQKT